MGVHRSARTISVSSSTAAGWSSQRRSTASAARVTSRPADHQDPGVALEQRADVRRHADRRGGIEPGAELPQEAPRAGDATRCPGCPPARCPPRRRPPAGRRLGPAPVVEMPKPTATGSRVARRTRCDRLGEVRGERATRAGDAQPGDQIDESLRAVHRGTEPLGPRGRRDEPDQVQPALLHGVFDAGIAPRRQIGQEQSRDAEALGILEEAIETVAENRVQVTEDHDRSSQPAAVDQLERARQRHALPQRLEGRALNGRPVGERIAEGHSDLEHVGELVRGAKGVLAGHEVRIAGGEIGDQRGAAVPPAGPRRSG